MGGLLAARWWPVAALAIGMGAPAMLSAAMSADVSAEAPFLTENQTAMDKMMADMSVKPSGDVDRDFAAMMIPHHQGAIDMARVELQYGKDPQIRKLAQDVIAAQQKEIAFMQAWQAKHAK